jgi:2,3-bisphosphoglycerate-independent phosphoglycerate mutase
LEEGSSEVGHLIIGSGKIIYQVKTRIDQSIANNQFLQNKAILDSINYAKINNSVLHLIGLISSSETMASMEHLISLIYMARTNGLNNICIHLISDGKDGSKNEIIDLINKLNEESSSLGAINIGSVAGRFYALNDHNEMYIDKFYNFLISENKSLSKNLFEHLNDLKNKNISDEFIEPFAVNQVFKPINSNDSIVFYNLKPNAFPIEYLISKFIAKTSNLSNLKITSLVDIKKDLNIPIAFPNEKIDNCLSMILSNNHKRQAHLSESIKSLHVTYYFNGLNKNPFPGEYWFILPSDSSLNFKENPYLEAPNITERAQQIMDENIYDFLLINYPNADIAGHTGDMDIAKIAISIIDNELEKIIKYGLSKNYTFIITSDHGNIERMKNPLTGEAEFGHDDSFVPIHIVDNNWKNQLPLTQNEILSREKNAIGVLADISPTILDIYKIAKPNEMTGQSILKILNLQ